MIQNRCKFKVSPKGADNLFICDHSNTESGTSVYVLYAIPDQLPNIDLQDKEELRKLLPYAELPNYTKILNKKNR